MSEKTVKKTRINAFLDFVERVCSKLPPPAILFCVLFVITAIIGAILTVTKLSLINPATGEAVLSKNFFSTAGVQWFLKNMVKNFTGFAPLGLVITMTLAIGLCEESNLLTTLLKRGLRNIPPSFVPYFIAFIGVVGNLASDTSAVVIPPLAALIYLSVGKNPIVGMLVGYAGANAGFTANLMIAGTDSLLQGLTNTAIETFLKGKNILTVEVTCNWFFMVASTFLCSLVIGYVSVKFIEPRFGKYEGEDEGKLEELKPEEKKGLHMVGIVALAYIALIIIGFFTKVLSTPEGKLLKSPLLSGLIPILFVFFALIGLTYGFVSGKYKTVTDVNKAMTKQMAAMGGYVVFCFFCGQFQGLFNWTNLGTLTAIGGADFLKSIGFTGIPMCIAFIIVCSIVNIFMSSGSAKWAIFAPIFVPMFMLLGYHPAFTQLLYRLGDSPGNSVTPMIPYIWMILSIVQQKYKKDCTIGTLIASLMPVAIILQIVWIIFLIIWMKLNLPIGPGTGFYLPPGIL